MRHLVGTEARANKQMASLSISRRAPAINQAVLSLTGGGWDNPRLGASQSTIKVKHIAQNVKKWSKLKETVLAAAWHQGMSKTLVQLPQKVNCLCTKTRRNLTLCAWFVMTLMTFSAVLNKCKGMKKHCLGTKLVVQPWLKKKCVT